MMKIAQIALLSLLIYSNTQAQSVLTFQAQELQKVAQNYTGNTANWPLIVEIADHNVGENTFTLSQPNILQLQNFSGFSAAVSAQKIRIDQLINSGATVFAGDEYSVVNTALRSYNSAVNAGDIEEAIGFAQSLKTAVDQMEESLNKNRIVDIQAQLSKKKGEVDKRTGLL